MFTILTFSPVICFPGVLHPTEKVTSGTHATSMEHPRGAGLQCNGPTRDKGHVIAQVLSIGRTTLQRVLNSPDSNHYSDSIAAIEPSTILHEDDCLTKCIRNALGPTHHNSCRGDKILLLIPVQHSYSFRRQVSLWIPCTQVAQAEADHCTVPYLR